MGTLQRIRFAGIPVAAFCLGLCAMAGDQLGERHQSYLLIDNGQARVRVVHPAKAEPEELAAAKLLSETLGKIGSTTVPVVDDGDITGPGLIDIHVGRTLMADRDDNFPADLDIDGFVIRPVDAKSLLLFGGRSVSTYYAVTEFLERYAGVLWVWPGDDGTVAPKTSHLSVDVREQVSEPAFEARRFSGMKDATMCNYRIHASSREVRQEFHHNVWRVLKEETYWEEHPEYYSEVMGKRKKPTPNKSNWQACTSNPAVVDIFIQAAKDQFEKRPWVRSFSVSQNDGGGFCACDNCTALDIPGEVGISDRYFTFMNAVADGVVDSYPDKLICCLAYGKATREVPKHVKLRPNTMIYAVIPTLADVHEEIRRWSKAAPNLGVYFWMHGKAVPKFYPHRFATYLQFLLEHNVRGVYAEVYQENPDKLASFALDGPRVWMMGKLLWNPQADIDALMQRFCCRFYGEAATEPMLRYYRQCETAWERREDPDDFGKKWRDLELGSLYQTNDVDIMEACIAQALSVTPGGPERGRLLKLQNAFGKAALWIREYDLGNLLGQMPIKDEETADEVLRRVVEAVQRSSTIKKEGRSLFGTLPHDCEAGIDQAFVRISAVLATRAGDYWQSRGATYPVLAPYIDTQLHSLADDLPNVIVNGGFEERSTAPEDLDPALNWEPFNATGWSKWIRPGTPGTITIGHEGARTGSRAVIIEGCEASCVLQKRMAQPGERYEVTCWARASDVSSDAPADAKTAGTLTIKWMDENGKWLNGIPSIVKELPRGVTEWTKLAVRLTVPADVGQVVIMLGASNQVPGEKVWFDDVGLFQLYVPPAE